MTTMAVVVRVLGIKGGTMPSNGEDLSGKDKMSKNSNDGGDGRSGGGVRDKSGCIAKQWRRFVVSRLVMYRTKVLMYRTMVLLAHLTKVRR